MRLVLSMIFRFVLVNALAFLWCASLLLYRWQSSGSTNFRFLIWNIFLAGLPLAAAFLLKWTQRWSLALPLLAFWLLFYPNAPYVITDLLHLRVLPYLPLWFDVLMIGSFALVSLLYGLQSLDLVHDWLAQRLPQWFAWCFVTVALLLSGFGIYLGRFLRWNSWDIVKKPDGLIQDISSRLLDPLGYERTWGVTLGFAGLQFVAYLMWRSRISSSTAALASR